MKSHKNLLLLTMTHFCVKRANRVCCEKSLLAMGQNNGEVTTCFITPC
jgi:hypothetical protein